MSQSLFRNFNLLDPRWDERYGGYEVLVDGGTIKRGLIKPIKAPEARVIDGGKRTLMPRPDRLPRPCLPDRGEHPPPEATSPC